MVEPVLFVRPFEPTFVSELSALVRDIFGEFDVADLTFRLEAMPDASVHAISENGRLVAFKLGYAVGRSRYLSWLGGVRRDHRRRGLARALLERQHTWVEERGYESIETGAIKSNQAMLMLNLSAGFEIIGSYARDATPRVMLHKQLIPRG